MTRKNRVNVQCVMCGISVSFTPSEINAGRKACSHACSKKYLWSKREYREQMSLAHKGKKPSNLEQLIANSRATNGNREKQLGQPAWNKGMRMEKIAGKNHYLWIEDRSLLKTDRRHAYDTRYKAWMKEVKNRDGWKCKISNGDCSGRLEAHHILPWKGHEELRYEINNGISLCHFHHPRKRSDEERLSSFFQELLLNET